MANKIETFCFILLIIGIILSIITIILIFTNKCNSKCAVDKFYADGFEIYDCFMISSGEEKILQLRLQLLNPYVTKFIIIDADEAHRGQSKKLVDMSNIPENIKEKIIYENCKFPNSMKITKIGEYRSKTAMAREHYQRNRIMDHLNKIAKDDDICLISDGDEIPFYDKILKLMKYDKIYWIEMLEWQQC